jgi:putative endonuclease
LPTDKATLGARGEQLTAEHLLSIGYTIVERNYRCSFGEIDIVARDGDALVFVEVKTRRGVAFGYPSEAVDARKQRKLIASAYQYLVERDLGEIDCRFDVAEVYFERNRPVRVELIQGAFWG